MGEHVAPEDPGADPVHAAAGRERASASLATTELVADGSGTRLIYTEQGAYFGGDPRREIAMREEGCGEMLDKLARELKEHG